MAELFLKVLNMSLSAGWLVLAVLVLRLLLRKAPRWIHVLLWGIVAVRLLCPFSLESVLSLLPSKQVVHPGIMLETAPQIHSGVEIINKAVNPILSESFAPNPGDSVNPLQIWIPLGGILWLLGAAMMVLFASASYFRLKKQVRAAKCLEGSVYSCQTVTSPFILGFFRPRIYLPADMTQDVQGSVIAHELSHIRRKDHWWKPLGYFLLCLHWFNPLMWLAYILLCRDIEMACDEAVIREMGTQQRADYSQALLQCSISRKAISACPLAFGEVDVKQRIKSVLRYKKPGFWIVCVSLVLCLILAVCFLTDPKEEHPSYTDKSLGVWIQDGDSVNKGEVRWNFFDIAEFDGVTLPGENPVKLSLVEVNDSGIRLEFDREMLLNGKKVRELFLKKTDSVTVMTATVGGATWYGFSVVDDKAITGDGLSPMASFVPLEGLPPQYTPEQAQADGCVVMMEGDVLYGKEIWWNFVKTAEIGAQCGVRIVEYFEGSNPPWYAKDLTFDGESFQIRWFEGTTELQLEYKYLRRSQGAAESKNAAYSSYERYFLTNDPNANWQNIWNSLFSSQSPAKTSDFKLVYTNLIYPSEPNYGTLASVQRKLEPLMGHYKIATIGVNEINWTLDIQVYEQVEGLEELVYSLLDPRYVRISQLEGSLSPVSGRKIDLGTIEMFSEYSDLKYELLMRVYEPEPIVLKPGESIWDKPISYQVLPEGYTLQVTIDYETITVKNMHLIVDDGWVIDVYNENVKLTLDTLEKGADVWKPREEEVLSMKALLTEICSSPLEASNPGAYIEAHRDAYQKLLSYHQKTLYWAFSEFKKGNQTGLPGHIMAQACRDIMASWGEEYEMEPLSMMTGQSWFAAFQSQAMEIRTENSVTDVKVKHPGVWLLLNLKSE